MRQRTLQEPFMDPEARSLLAGLRAADRPAGAPKEPVELSAEGNYFLKILRQEAAEEPINLSAEGGQEALQFLRLADKNNRDARPRTM